MRRKPQPRQQVVADTFPGVQSLAIATAPTSFSDIADTAWYASAVKWCLENDIMSGTTDTTLAPGADMSRSDVADALYRSAGRPAATYGGEFSDMTADSTYASAVARAAEQKIMSGYGGGTFGADDHVTREQLVTLLWRYAGSPDAETDRSFADENSISSYALTAVDWVRANDIINGRNGNIFDPKATITHAEIAVILYRYLTETDSSTPPADSSAPTVYMIADISLEGMMAVYEALNWTSTGETAVKLIYRRTA